MGREQKNYLESRLFFLDAHKKNKTRFIVLSITSRISHLTYILRFQYWAPRVARTRKDAH